MKNKKPFKLDNYEKKNKIGSGSFGEVFEIEEKKTGKILAAKISKQTLDEFSSDFSIDLTREVEILSKVDHPSVLKFIGFSPVDFDNNKRPVIVTEYLPNGSLEDILKLAHKSCPDENWTETRQLINIYGLASAMEYLHNNNIIHRDLKPGNILMDEMLFPKVADFGLSKDDDTLKSIAELKGTPLYIAPEIWDRNEYSKASDVYAFGLIVYEIVTNEKPFTNLTMLQISRKVCSGIRPDIHYVPSEGYRDLIQQCWSQDPLDRPTFEEITQALRENDEFITDMVDKDDFLYYVDIIDKSPKRINEKNSIDITKFIISDSSTFKPVTRATKSIYPSEKYKKLNKECKKLVDEALKNPNKQFTVGKCLIEASHGFPQDLQTGIAYLKSSIEKGNTDSVIYYNKMLIDGEIIPQDLSSARKNLQRYRKQHISEIILLLGKIQKLQENYDKAIDYFLEAAEAGNGEAMFEYGKMLYFGEGVDKDEKEAKRNFIFAKRSGFAKSEEYLNELKKSKSRSSIRLAQKMQYSKKVDIVFLIDATKTMRFLYDSLRDSFYDIVNECQNKYSNIYFRFGVVIYRNSVVTKRSKVYKPEKYAWIDLTDESDEVQSFLDRNKTFGGGQKLAKDWKSGYNVLNNIIQWNKKAEKVVIHICDSPSHGKFFMMKPSLARKLIRVPNFVGFGKNYFRKNLEIMRKIEMNENFQMQKQIENLASKGIMFYCINGNDIAIQCFNKISQLYSRLKGKKFIIKNLYGFDYFPEADVDKNELNRQIIGFSLNTIESVVDGKDDDSDFEKECKFQFEEDLNHFNKVNKSNSRFTDTTETDNDDDLEEIEADDFDDDDDIQYSSEDDNNDTGGSDDVQYSSEDDNNDNGGGDNVEYSSEGKNDTDEDNDEFVINDNISKALKRKNTTNNIKPPKQKEVAGIENKKKNLKKSNTSNINKKSYKKT